MLRKFLHFLSFEARKQVVQALMTFRLDYDNAVYLGLPVYRSNKLLVVQNTASLTLLGLPLKTLVSTFERVALALY